MTTNKGGAPKGNNNAGKNKAWSDAVRKALIQSKGGIAGAAKQLVKLANSGDLSALKEIGDRLDGRPAQAVQADVGGTVTIEQVIYGDPAKAIKPLDST